MRILVTGAAGFAGRHIAAHLAAAGHHVVAGYRSAPLPPALAAAPNVEPRRLKLNGSPPAVPPEPGEFEAIIHAAATSPNSPGVTDGSIVNDGAPAVKAMLALADATRAARIIYLSSISVYGTPRTDRINENAELNNPDLYGRAKFLGEKLMRDWTEASEHRFGLSIRLPGIIGPGATRVWLSRVAEDLRANRTVKIYNPGALYNNAVHVHDLAVLCENAIQDRYPCYDMCTLGAGGYTTPLEAVSRMAQVLNSKSMVERCQAPRPSFTISSQHARDNYNYEPMNILPMVERYAQEANQ